MKKGKAIIAASFLMLLSTSAFATKARLMALGEDKDGSYFISDYRNIYINPAELNSMPNAAILEWGATGTAFGKASIDGDDTPKAEGGVFYTLFNGLKVGASLGDESDVASLVRMMASNNTSVGSSQLQMLQSDDNVLDVFVAGKGSVNWGANALYTSSKSEVTGARYSQSAYAVRLGVSQERWNLGLLLALSAKADALDYAKTPTFKGKLGVAVAGGYDITSENKIFGMAQRYSWDQSSTEFATRAAGFDKEILGIGHTKKVSDKSTLFAKFSGEAVNIKLDAIGSTLGAAEINSLIFPMAVGFEHAATDWLTVRGSVVQNLYGEIKDSGLTTNFGTTTLSTLGTGAATSGELVRYLAYKRYGSSLSGNGGKKTVRNSTVVNGGATLTFGTLAIDGLVGATSGARNGTIGSNTNKGTLAFDNLETRVGVTYKF